MRGYAAVLTFLGLWMLDSPSALADSDQHDIKGSTLSDLAITVADMGVESWQYPISPSKRLGSPYGPRTRMTSTGKRHFHHGQDIYCEQGENIYAAADGVVAVSLYSRTAGHYITLQHTAHNGLSLQTRYLHLSKRLTRVGHSIKAGELIGRCGSTGQSTGPHLHFEVIVNDKSADPLRFRHDSDLLQCQDIVGSSLTAATQATTQATNRTSLAIPDTKVSNASR
jgi:murein DD-endopeptidase MepM/ murein hydrolase activator NlpD